MVLRNSGRVGRCQLYSGPCSFEHGLFYLYPLIVNYHKNSAGFIFRLNAFFSFVSHRFYVKFDIKNYKNKALKNIVIKILFIAIIWK